MKADLRDIRRLARAGLDAEGRPVLALAGTLEPPDDGSTWRFCWARVWKNGGAAFSDREVGLSGAPDPLIPRVDVPAGTFEPDHPRAGEFLRCRILRRRRRAGPYVVFKARWHPIAPKFKRMT